MPIVSLNCLIYGDEPAFNRIFEVYVSLEEHISALRGKIWEEIKNQHGRVDAKNFILYTLMPPISTASKATFNQAIAQLHLDTEEGRALVEELNPTFRVEEYDTLATPGEKLLHVIAVVPTGECSTYQSEQTLIGHHRKRKRMDYVNDAGAIIERWRSKRFLKTELPAVAELARIVDLPLSEDEKIPIATESMKGLVSSIDVQDICTPDDVKLLFRAGSGNTPLDRFFFPVAGAPPIHGSAKLFISFWDKNVRDILELIIPNGWSTRNSSWHTATRSLRPGYAFLLNKLCVFRGEESSPESTDDLKKELASKLVWAYNPAPYVLGYYATGPDLTLVAISPPPQGQSLPVVHDIASVNLRRRRDRIKNICRLINLAGLFKPLADLVRPSDAEFEPLERDYGTVEIAGHNVIKSFTGLGPDKFDRVLRLRYIYSLLGNKEVPHVDSLVHTRGTTVVLSPRGIAEQPKTEKELLEALICVLEALEVLHKSPPVFHRDIRWPNVMRRLDDPHRWFIIDWDDAAVPPTKAQSHFSRTAHSPGVFTDGHGAEVDIWGVGELILKCKALDVPLELQNLGKWMQGSIAPSAQEALGKIKGYQSSHF